MKSMKETPHITLDASLTPSLLLPNRRRQAVDILLNQSEIKRYLFYSYGRIALLDGLKILDCKRGSNVLLPSCICSLALEPFRELGIETRFYEVSLNLQPNIADIKKEINNKTSGILIVNYFGFPQDLGEIQDICQENGLYLIEDNSHGLLSHKDSHLLGTYGDIGFSSIWKILPVLNGALLFVNNEKLVDSKGKIERYLISQNQLPQVSKKKNYMYILNSLLCNLGIRHRVIAQFIQDIYQKLFPKKELRKLNDSQMFQDSKVRISDISLQIINKMDLENVFEKRRQNYGFWASKLTDREDVRFVFDGLPAGVCPLYFVVIEKEADSFSSEMIAMGIQTDHWPPLPKEIKDNPEYPNANFLAKHLVLLPVHQSLSQDCLAKAVSK